MIIVIWELCKFINVVYFFGLVWEIKEEIINRRVGVNCEIEKGRSRDVLV